MNNNEKTISVAEAKSTLESLAKIEQDTNVSIRAPLWLNFIISCSYGMGVFSWASTRHENQWMLGVIASFVVFILATAFYLYSNRLLGVKPKLVPKSRSEYISNFLVAIFFGLVIALSREFSKNDIWWASFAGAVVAALSLAYFMHKYPSGDFNPGRYKND